MWLINPIYAFLEIKRFNKLENCSQLYELIKNIKNQLFITLEEPLKVSFCILLDFPDLLLSYIYDSIKASFFANP